MDQFWKLIRRFRSDERGVFAVIFGVLAIVLVVSSGGVVDFVGVQNARSMAQPALDSATLSLHSEIDDLNETQIGELAESLINDRLDALGLSASVETVSINTEEGTLFIEARFAYTTAFLSLIGIDTINSRIHSEVTSKSLNIEVALVLDSTASMGGPKLAALKSSARALVDELMPEESNPDISIALVPFNRYVNIGRSNRSEPGLDIEADYTWTPAGERCWNTYPNDTRRCDRRRVSYACTRDGVPSTCTRWQYYNCTGSRGDPVRVCRPQYTRNFRWYGCMGSRHLAPFDTVDTNYATDPVPGIIRHWNTCRVTPMTELTHTRADLRTAITAMRARDNTYIPTGLMWGWRLLSPQTPFTAEPYNDENKKVIVLMTDGMNTISPNLAWTASEGSTHRV
ncbi:MAG: pilus assembly protein, partial [Devosiaceae bacterium]|nr:pilus assembly protein [Devosiaceae bacterium]